MMEDSSKQDQPQYSGKNLSEEDLAVLERALELEQLEEREYQGTYRNDQA
ncbi:hypothetical protein M2125_000573 [Polynucleobacter sphagniphilus]|jgi:hypothetical protein|nr:hypothetical protein [Polynucleobacter sphagniphilus]MDH6240783.1 hypothetical protein [Polynucleobacter sphagniphilus]MDH6300477.1 hypothetical protein [Polynucleobacter sphagniphilus]MDH6420426.1 hypothetical protein [Polynucleobacter sphagniphilus]MDH6523523.1 hypothetical protein [Polynucleobacter sphagniphilus]